MMSSWAERVHRRAADFGSVVTSCGHPGSSTPAYPYRLEKVKFGVPLEEVCKINNNIPGPLLVLILKLNKESPNKRDVFRAPGHQGAMKKLIHFLQTGRLVNVDNYSVYTIASVLKKFLRKIPNGIFGRSGEKELFAINELHNEAEQTERLQRLFSILPRYTQHLLVLLFGTFRVIASNATHAGTGMTSEALGVSVAPSFFQSCVSDGKTARMEDVLKFKVATKIMQHIIDKFATHDLFGRENYEYYARVTGRILKVQDEWICSFQYPPPPRGKLAQQKYALQHSLEAEKTWLQCQCERWGLLAQEESRSTPALLTSSSSALENSVLSLGVSPEHSFIESCARLSVSLEGPGLFAMTSSPLPKQCNEVKQEYDHEDNYADDDDDDYSAELEEISNDEADEQKLHLLKIKHQEILHTPNPKSFNSENNDNREQTNDDNIFLMKRRYRQNIKKTALKSSQMRGQHQRRLRTGTKSLDDEQTNGEGDTKMSTNFKDLLKNKYVGSAEALNKCPTTNHNEESIHVSKYKCSNNARACSRCTCGIRHASSCSSTSGATNPNDNMTMDELRAVNRYAESTKSLSYLPQVHQRQTERMRSRSDWFLNPRNDIVTLKLNDSCSNCSLLKSSQQSCYLEDFNRRVLRTQIQKSVDNITLETSNKIVYRLFKTQQHWPHQNKLRADHMDIDECLATPLHSTKKILKCQNILPAPGQQALIADDDVHSLFLDTNSAGNIRMSTSADSFQNARRSSNRRPLVHVPRHYPIRSSFRRNKEKLLSNTISSIDKPPSMLN